MSMVLSSPRHRPAALALIHRNVAERKRLIVSLTLAAVAISAMVASLYSSVGPAYDDALAGLPDAIKSMLGDADFSTPEGFVQVELFSFVAPGLAIGAAISLAAGALAGAEQSGRLALITAGPIRRTDVVTAAIGGTVIAVVAVVAGVMAGVLAGAAVGDLAIPFGRIFAMCVSLGLLAMAVGMITLAVGAATGRRGLAVGVGTAVAVLSYAVDAFFPLSSTLDAVGNVTLWYPFDGHQPLLNGLNSLDAATLFVVAAAAATVSYRVFDRRDINS